MLPSSSRITPEPSSSKKPNALLGRLVYDNNEVDVRVVRFLRACSGYSDGVLTLSERWPRRLFHPSCSCPYLGFGANVIVTPVGAPENVNVAVGTIRSCVRLMFTDPVPPASISIMGGTIAEKIQHVAEMRWAGQPCHWIAVQCRVRLRNHVALRLWVTHRRAELMRQNDWRAFSEVPAI